jgi:DNA polymerase-1
MIHRARFGWNRGDDAITFNFFRSLKSEIDRHTPNKVYVVSEGTPKQSLEANPDYKANRVKILDDGFYRQKRDIFEICKTLPVTFIRHPDFECDDVIGFLAQDVHASDEVTICSSDSDFIQLINDSVKLWNPVKKKFVEKWPVDYVTWKSLTGDKTDNIPGIKGVGQKTALKLASKVEDLENFLNKGENRKIFDSAHRQIKLKKIELNDKSIQECDYTFKKEELLQEFTLRKFNSIVSKGWPKWIDTMETLNEKRTIIS